MFFSSTLNYTYRYSTLYRIKEDTMSRYGTWYMYYCGATVCGIWRYRMHGTYKGEIL